MTWKLMALLGCLVGWAYLILQFRKVYYARRAEKRLRERREEVLALADRFIGDYMKIAFDDGNFDIARNCADVLDAPPDYRVRVAARLAIGVIES